MLLQRYLNVYQYMQVERDEARLRSMPPGWGYWMRSVKRERPRVFGLFERVGGSLWALYALDGRIYIHTDQTRWPLSGTTAVVVDGGDNGRTARLILGDEVIYSVRYDLPKQRPWAYFDPTPHQELVRVNILEIAAALASDPDRLASATRDWSRGFVV